MIQIAICSSNERDRKELMLLLQRRLYEMSADASVVCFANANALFNAFSADAYSFVFLDTELSDMTGIEAARRLRSEGGVCPLLFVSGTPKDVLASYDVHAAGFFLKPVQYDELCALLRRHRLLFKDALRSIEILCERIERSIFLTDILYIEARGRTSLIHTTKGGIATNRAIGELEAQMKGEPFLRCHRSYLANIGHILCAGERTLVMENKAMLPVSAERSQTISDTLRKIGFSAFTDAC